MAAARDPPIIARPPRHFARAFQPPTQSHAPRTIQGISSGGDGRRRPKLCTNNYRNCCTKLHRIASRYPVRKKPAARACRATRHKRRRCQFAHKRKKTFENAVSCPRKAHAHTRTRARAHNRVASRKSQLDSIFLLFANLPCDLGPRSFCAARDS